MEIMYQNLPLMDDQDDWLLKWSFYGSKGKKWFGAIGPLETHVDKDSNKACKILKPIILIFCG